MNETQINLAAYGGQSLTKFWATNQQVAFLEEKKVI